MIPREAHLGRVELLLDEFPVVALVGARQTGKTTLSRVLAERWEGRATVFDLEDPRDRARLADPTLTLEPLEGLVVLDEIQHEPDVFAFLRVLADRPERPARFLVLGSASPRLLQQTSESLAGRIAFHELTGLRLAEAGREARESLWSRGGMPRSFLAASDAASLRWRDAFLRTFLERDLFDFGFRHPPETMRRLWTMLAHHHGQVSNAAELSRSLGVSVGTVRNYVDILCSTFMARRLTPWSANLGKRQVKSPKVYIEDPGLLHALLGITSHDDLLGHPKCGASWEGFAIGEVVSALGARWDECFFWGLHTGAELDLLIVRGRQRRAFEIKLTATPRITRSMHSARENLELDEVVVIHAGDDAFPLAEGIRAVPLQRVADEVDALE